jgi:hypothetical protein
VKTSAHGSDVEQNGRPDTRSVITIWVSPTEIVDPSFAASTKLAGMVGVAFEVESTSISHGIVVGSVQAGGGEVDAGTQKTAETVLPTSPALAGAPIPPTRKQNRKLARTSRLFGCMGRFPLVGTGLLGRSPPKLQRETISNAERTCRGPIVG